jgi:hypothetical protein
MGEMTVYSVLRYRWKMKKNENIQQKDCKGVQEIREDG